MAMLLDANIWVDFSRTNSPAVVKQFAARFVLDPQACLAEPIIFELLRSATEADANTLLRHFETVPILSTPSGLWNSGVRIGRDSHKNGDHPGSIDLLIAAIAIYHKAELVTFDKGFEIIAQTSDLHLKLITRPKR